MKRLAIGDWVEVSATVLVIRDGSNRRLCRIGCRPRNGQVCGATIRHEGVISKATGGGIEDHDPPFLRSTKRHQVYLVRRGVTNAPEEVFPDDLRRIEPPTGDLPWRYANQSEWSDSAREAARRDALAAPRKNGRFA